MMACSYEDSNVRFQVIEEELYKAYAMATRKMLYPVIQKECCGCQIDYPSQKQRVVCLVPFEEQMEYYMEDALKLVLDDTQVKEDWIKAIETLFPGQDISSILLFECRELVVDFDTKEGRERLKSHFFQIENSDQL